MAEARDIAVVAAALAACRRLEAGVIAIRFMRSDASASAGRPWMKGVSSMTPPIKHLPVSRLRTNVVNGPLTMIAMAANAASAMSARCKAHHSRRRMLPHLFILLGFFSGLAIRNPLKGV